MRYTNVLFSALKENANDTISGFDWFGIRQVDCDKKG
jgi:hypothetical protein